MKAIILAAGLGTRLGKDHPKALTLLENGKSILANQVQKLERYIAKKDIFVVVGYKKELIIEAFPELSFVINDDYHVTNTSKSLLKGLEAVGHSDVIWLNGDVFFDQEQVLSRVIQASNSCVAVNTVPAEDEEEVKYTINASGTIDLLSKEIPLDEALGEAVGINKVKSNDVAILREKLELCNEQDFFEKAIELAILQNKTSYHPIDISDLICQEIDTKEDLQVVNQTIQSLKYI
ncbi:NTP transferase domain-containing protein [Amphibacillus sp. Q70]|uniref:phosphocholine cytidylyltransferase family protein n=1 Tax=Amphibacillus sp. Q70 TaxID=3453416 RepID=UPI003F854B23